MNRKTETAYLGMGSNLGDRLSHLTDALHLLKKADEIRVSAWSPVYETAPVGYESQPDFLNCVVEIETALSPHALLDVCMRIEAALLRERTVRWGPRTVDLDILFYGDRVINEKRLTIPHPRLHEREFALRPMCDLAPEFLHPVCHATVAQLLEELVCGRESGEAVRLFCRSED